MQVPDAVYHLMRHTELKRCNLSGNVITKIPPKFAIKFSLITGKLINNNVKLLLNYFVNKFYHFCYNLIFNYLKKILFYFFFYLLAERYHCNTNSNT